MTFTIKIECDNAAFSDVPLTETARILRKVVDALENDELTETSSPMRLRDCNGNRVGSAEFAE